MADMVENLDAATKNIEENDEKMDDSDKEDSDSDAESSMSEDEDNDESELSSKCDELEKQITTNLFMYDNHVVLIKNLRALGDLEKLRCARQRMSELFPLSEELWLEWLQDEAGLLTGQDGRSEVTHLFERAVKDYLSVPVWLEYVQYCIGDMGQKDGVKTIRQVFETALVACGLHVTKGNSVWEAYREFENAILVGLLPKPGTEATTALTDQFSEQHDIVHALFKRQLKIPLFEMDDTYKEYCTWLQDEPDNYTKQTHKKALIKLEKIRPYEHKLMAAEVPRLEEYQEYLVYEEKEGDPARIQCLFERAIQENCLNPVMWLQYTKYLDHSLKVSTVSLPVYQRAVRNCPWCVQLWQNYILLLERSGQGQDKVKEVFETALCSGISQGSEYLQLWTTYIDYLRRKIKWDQDHTEDLETFRLYVEKGIDQLDEFGTESDPNGTLRQFWAVIEAKYCKNLEKSRQLWSEIMSLGKANEAALWLEYIRFERTYGDNKHCRKILQRGLNSVTDWPESVVDAYINFEREEGTLEQYDLAVSRCAAQMARITERRAKEESQNQETGNKKSFDKKGGRKFDNKQQHGKQKPQQFGKQKQNQQYGKQKPQNNMPHQKQPNQQQTLSETEVRPYKRKHTETANFEDSSFKVPLGIPISSPKSTPPPGFINPNIVPPPGYKGEGERSAPPPGYKAANNITVQDDEGPASKKIKTEPVDNEIIPGSSADWDTQNTQAQAIKTIQIEPVEGQTIHDSSADCKTAFVSNLSYKVDEGQLKSFFTEKVGVVEELRLVKNIMGKSKGYAFVVFADQTSVAKALTHDRTHLEGRPMYVSRSEDRSNKTKADFRYSNSMEKNKLFVKNLPFTCTKAALETMFGQHGELKEVRMVTYKSGQFKGLAYVEYVDEKTASAALIKTDNMLVGEHNISVAISNQPGRKAPEGSFTPALGGGKKETASRGVARTNVMLMPRAVAKKPTTQPSTSVKQTLNQTPTSTQSDSKNSSQTGSKLSNSDFRNMLLKK